MKLNTLFFAASLMTASMLLSFCTKETPVSEPVPAATDSGDEAASRGVCKVLILATNATVDVCGSQTSNVTCSPGLVGSDVIPNGNTKLYVVQTPTSMILTRDPNMPSSVFATATVTTSSGTVVYNLPASGAPVVVNIDNNCNQ